MSMMCLGFAAQVYAAKKKASDGAPTEVQRKKAYESGLIECRKKFGAQLHFVRVQKYYGKWSVVCYHY